jgi:choline dehydrogenase-like flavoprotein
MQRLSITLADYLDRDDSPKKYDALVVGSGYGGAVAALRLAEKGYSVLLLERGSEYVEGMFPNDLSQLSKHFRVDLPSALGYAGRPAGLFNLRLGDGLVAVVGNGLGGGSLINAGVVIRPDREVFGLPQWPPEIAGDDAAMAQAFAQAEKMLRAVRYEQAKCSRQSPGPDEVGGSTSGRGSATPVELSKTRALRMFARRVGKEGNVKPAFVAIDLDACTGCGDCVSGCNQPGAKLSLPATYLSEAARYKVVMLARATVYTVLPVGDDRQCNHGKWVVRAFPTERLKLYESIRQCDSEESVAFEADMVVLAAGTFGSTEILLRARARGGKRADGQDALPISASLGTRLSANGDALAFSSNEADPVNAIGAGAGRLGSPPCGPTITAIFDLRDAVSLRDRVLIEDGAVPGAIARLFREGLATAFTVSQLGKWSFGKPDGGKVDHVAASTQFGRHAQVLLAMGHDDASGRIVWLSESDMAVPYWSRPEDEAVFALQERLFDHLNFGGASYLANPLWRLLPESATEAMSGPRPKSVITTVHPLGGCPMGRDIKHGVVNHRGQVYSGLRRDDDVHGGLYVLDGAIVPTSLGVNPLLTITALAERAMSFVECSKDTAAGESPPKLSVKPFQRQEEERLGVRFSERLLCDSLSIHGATEGESMKACLTIEFGSDDWFDVLERADHFVKDCTAELVLDCGTVVTRFRGTGSMALLPAPERPARLRLLPRVLLTYLADRFIGDVLRNAVGRRRPWEGGFSLRNLLGMVLGILKQFIHATEERSLTYSFQVKHEDGESVVDSLELRGEKHVGYAAHWDALRAWGKEAVVVLFEGLVRWGRGRGFQVHLPRLQRETFLEQVSNPRITLVRVDGAEFGGGRFVFDQRYVARDQPPRLGERGDLSNGLLGIGGYGGYFIRYAAKTRLLDLRLPDYSGEVYRDCAPPEEIKLRVGTNGVFPERIPLRVPRGITRREGGEGAATEIDLVLWRYRRQDVEGKTVSPCFTDGDWLGRKVRRVHSVLLLHAFGQSGLSFTFKETSKNLAEALYEAGYEVWMLESRMSTRLGRAEDDSSVDLIAENDVPTAVDCILKRLGDDPAVAGKGSGPEPYLQIFAFAQCIGSAALAMSMLKGALAYRGVSVDDDKTGVRRTLSKLAGVMLSQVTPFIVGSPGIQAKTWVPALIRDGVRLKAVPFAVRGPVDSLVEAWADRLFASFPVPADEQCPECGDSTVFEDAAATCRRIRFIEAPLFLHKNLNRETHAALNRLFGDANVNLFAHARRFVEFECLVDEDGANAYVLEGNLVENMAMPVGMLHGRENDLFNVAGSERTRDQLLRLNRPWQSQLEGEGLSVCEGYGHLDVLIGRNAHRDVFERVTGFFAQAREVNVNAPPEIRRERIALPPAVGPVVGWTRRLEDGSFKVRLSFIADQTWSDAYLSAAQSRMDGYVKPVWAGVPISCQALGFRQSPRGWPSLRAFWVDVPVESAKAAQGPLRIDCLTLHHRIHAQPEAGPAPGQDDVGDVDQAPSAANSPDFAVHIEQFNPVQGEAGTGRLEKAEFEALASKYVHDAGEHNRLLASRTHPPVSILDGRVWPTDTHFTEIPSHVFASLDPAATSVTFAAGCCRYPGFAVDRVRADSVFARLASVVAGEELSARELVPAFCLMTGDQIYADATAGIVDPLSPVERYSERYFQAFTSPNFRALLARLPVYMCADDHEFAENWPDGVKDWNPTHNGDTLLLRQHFAAMNGLSAFQLLSSPSAGDVDDYAFEHGPLRVYVMDTRTQRVTEGRRTSRILSDKQLKRFARWVDEGSAMTGRFSILVTGAVIAPGFVPNPDPADAGRLDGFEGFAAQRSAVLQLLSSKLAGRFMILSGDYHVSTLGSLSCEGRAVGAAAICPPFYAPLPYANGSAAQVLRSEDIVLGGNSTISYRTNLEEGDGGALEGSGYALVSVSRLSEERWRVEMRVMLNRFEAYQGWMDRLQLVGQIDLQPSGG